MRKMVGPELSFPDLWNQGTTKIVILGLQRGCCGYVVVVIQAYTKAISDEKPRETDGDLFEKHTNKGPFEKFDWTKPSMLIFDCSWHTANKCDVTPPPPPARNDTVLANKWSNADSTFSLSWGLKQSDEIIFELRAKTHGWVCRVKAKFSSFRLV